MKTLSTGETIGKITLALRCILFAALLPGTVTVTTPFFILHYCGATLPRSWSASNYLGLLLLIPSAAVLFRCIWDFAAIGRGTLAPVDPPKELIVRGFYRYVRNPMYVAVLMILFSEILIFSSLALLWHVAIFITIVNMFVIFYEEPTLRRQFGKSYEAYCNRVNRWLPTFPRHQDAEKV